MSSPLTLQPYTFFNSDSFGAEENIKYSRNGITKIVPFRGFVLTCSSSSSSSSTSKKWIFPCSALSSITPNGPFSLPNLDNSETDLTRVNYLVRIIHESASNFSMDIQKLDFVKPKPELAMAWVGLDVHAWHKHISYQVAVYGMLKAVIEVELFLSHKRCNNPSPVQEILSPKINFLEEHLESQLNKKNPKLIEWFKTIELPRITELFVPLFKKWSLDYAGSGVAGIILAISCCVAIKKLSCSLVLVEDSLLELMNSGEALVSIERFYELANEAGFEEEFLNHFGQKVLPNENIENLEFLVGLVEKKLCAAFDRETEFTHKHNFHDKKVLATLGLFAYLGRETRLFFSTMNIIKELDEQTNDFLGYLECGSLLIYPEFSTLSEYQLFMEIVTDEIGWLDFYAAFTSRDNKKWKQNGGFKPEKEIIIYTGLTVCYDVISGFAHYTNSKQQTLSSNLLEFLVRSQNLLSTCLEDFWAAYGETRCAQLSNHSDISSCLLLEAQNRKPIEKFTETSSKKRESLLKRSTHKVVSTTRALLMGSELLFIDISELMRIMMKQIRGNEMITRREKKKIETTVADMATLVPITILMLLPVTAIGHAAMLAGIKRYMPYLIPSPYSSERRTLVKQMKRTKKMEIQPLTNAQNLTSRML